MTIYDLIKALMRYPPEYTVVLQQQHEGDSSYHDLEIDEGFLPSNVVTLYPTDLISG